MGFPKLKTFKVTSIGSTHYEQVVSATDKDAAVNKAEHLGNWSETGYSAIGHVVTEIDSLITEGQCLLTITSDH